MKYQEFRNSEEAKIPNQWWILDIERKDKIQTIICQWEPSNAKWYKPEPLDGWREECGYTNEIWFEEPGNWTIQYLRGPLIRKEVK